MDTIFDQTIEKLDSSLKLPQNEWKQNYLLYYIVTYYLSVQHSFKIKWFSSQKFINKSFFIVHDN